MGVYIVGFIMSTLLFALAEKVVKSQRWFVYLIALLIPCCIAGFRDRSVGTDVQVYLVQMTTAAIYSGSLSEYMNTSWHVIGSYVRIVSQYEIGFSMLVYMTAKIFRNMFAVQFAVQVFTIVPIYIANTKFKDEFPMWLSMLTYYLMFFNRSLNMMRQCIAMSFVYLAFAYLKTGKKKKCMIAAIAALFFHISALMGILLYFLYKYTTSDGKGHFLGRRKIPNRYTHMLIAIMAGVMVVLGNNTAANFMSLLGLGRYAVYIKGAVEFMPNQIISRLPTLILFLYFWRKMRTEQDTQFLFTAFVLELLFSQFSSVNSFGGRVALYFAEFKLEAHPILYSKTGKKKWVLVLLIAYMAFYWWFYYVLKGVSETLPYKFGF